VRVVVYNVRGFRSGTERVAEVVRRFRPELMLLQETGGRLALRRFARTMGMGVAGDPWSPLARRVKDAVLVASPWRIVDHHQHRFSTVDRLYPRGVLLALIEAADRRVWAVSTHLGLRPAERLRHAEELVGLIEGLDGPILVGGDLNEHPDGSAVRALGERLWDVWLLGGDVAGETFPAAEPTARIDYLFVSEGVRVERAIVPPTPQARTASDHRPLVVEIAL
jgi:endonuclease/exonuclease/phosphatase family metal-dependent hydrolase